MQLLEKLVKDAEPSQIVVYDEMIKERPEFSLHVGLAKAYGGEKTNFDAKFVMFNQVGPIPKNKPATSTRKSSLAWLMALARIELGATLSTFTTMKKPFEKLAPTPFEKNHFELLLLDDAITHALTIKDDPNFAAVTKRNRMANLQSLDYWRRLKLVRDMLDYVNRNELFSSDSRPSIADTRKELRAKARDLYSNISNRARHLDPTEESMIVDTPSCAAAMLEAAAGQGDIKKQNISGR